MHDQIDHDVRRLVATSTNDALIRYVQELAETSYTNGFRKGYYRREDARLRTILWQCVRRGLRRFVRWMTRTLYHHATHYRVPKPRYTRRLYRDYTPPTRSKR